MTKKRGKNKVNVNVKVTGMSGFFDKVKKAAKEDQKNKCSCSWSCCSKGVGFWGYGSMLAMILSYAKGSSLFWTLLHGLFSWFYIIYRLFTDLNFF